MFGEKYEDNFFLYHNHFDKIFYNETNILIRRSTGRILQRYLDYVDKFSTH